MIDDNSQAQIDIVYDGPALVEGSMNVRDLAPAMMAIGGFFEAANRITNQERASVTVNVVATSVGSFHVAFQVVQDLQNTGVLGSNIDDYLTTANALKALLLGGGGIFGGIFWLTKILRGRKPQIERINAGLYKLTIDRETYEVPIELLNLYQEAVIRRNIENMVKPVKEPGIDRFMIREGDQTIHEVTKNDVEAFDTPEFQDLILDEVRRQAFSIVSLAFKENNKWRLTDGQNTFSVSMKDESFQHRVDNNSIAFAKGDVLVCDLRTIQWQVESGVKSDYEVVRVVTHRPARQLGFWDIDNSDRSPDQP